MYDVEFVCGGVSQDGKLETLPSAEDIIELHCVCGGTTVFIVGAIVRRYSSNCDGGVRDLHDATIMLELLEDTEVQT